MVIVLGSQVIHYTHEGNPQGQPLILLHGNGQDLHIYDELAAALSESFDIYRIDSRGHGQSACPERLHYKDMALDVEVFIRELSIEKPLLAGYSDGAITALIIAMTRPDLLSAVISCSARTSPSAFTFQERQRIKKEFSRKISSAPPQKEIDTLSSEVYVQSGELERLMLDEPSISRIALSHIRIPVLCMAAEKDVVKEADTRKMASSIKKGRLFILPGEVGGSYVVHSAKLAEYVKELGARN